MMEKMLKSIVDKIVAGETLFGIKKQLIKEGISEADALNYIREAKRILSENRAFVEDAALDIQLERLNTLYRLAMANDQTRLALNILDQINKLLQLYTVRVDANVEGDFVVEFG